MILGYLESRTIFPGNDKRDGSLRLAVQPHVTVCYGWAAGQSQGSKVEHGESAHLACIGQALTRDVKMRILAPPSRTVVDLSCFITFQFFKLFFHIAYRVSCVSAWPHTQVIIKLVMFF